MRYIDLRSDTVTQPTQAMRNAMAAAVVGDDVFDDDPTLHELEAYAAKRLGKEAAVFVTSGMQGNACALLAHTRRGDCVIIADGTLDIVDYKHGKGVEVSAIENPQMMLYALGALELFDGIYDIDTVRMTIFQPRRDNVSVCLMAKDDLLQWAHNDLTYKAKLAYEGSGEFACGDWCRFCKAKAVCRKRAEYNLELAKYDFEMPDTLEDAEIAAILDKADELTAWAADVKEYALRQALSGTEYPGYKVVEGRSNRRYISEESVADAVSQAGYDPYAKKVLGLTEMQKLLGKKKFDELLGGLIEKPQGKPVLVPLSDKRQPINTAQNDFKD